MVEVVAMPFATLVLRALISVQSTGNGQRQAVMDGASDARVLLNHSAAAGPAIVTVIVVSSVGIYNDFAGPLYFCPSWRTSLHS